MYHRTWKEMEKLEDIGTDHAALPSPNRLTDARLCAHTLAAEASQAPCITNTRLSSLPILCDTSTEARMCSIRQHRNLKLSASEARPLARHLEGLAYRDPLTPFQLST
jgi:hypothetical protein